MKIIIADADRDFCEMLESQLAHLLHDVSIKGVFDGKELVRRTEELCPDLVVVNLLLPEKDGLAAMQAIRAMSLHRQPELVVLSGYLNPHMQEELCRLRPAFFTALPCDLAVLADRIRLCCRELICRMLFLYPLRPAMAHQRGGLGSSGHQAALSRHRRTVRHQRRQCGAGHPQCLVKCVAAGGIFDAAGAVPGAAHQ